MSIALDPSEIGLPVPQYIFTTKASKRAWHAHVDKLDPQDREFFLKHATEGIDSFSSLVQRTCSKHRDQSKISKLSDLLKPFRKTLGMAMSIASTASQADPYPSSLVIGGIIGLLQICDNFDSFQRLIMNWLSKLSEKAALLIEFDICIYQYDDDIQDALVLVYGDILTFCQKALRLYMNEEGNRRSGFVVFGQSLVERFSDTFGKITDSFERNLDNYEARARLCDSRKLTQIYRDVVNLALQQRQDHKEIMDSLVAERIETRERQLQSYEAQVSSSQGLLDAFTQGQKGIIDEILAGKTREQAQADQREAEQKRAREDEEKARRQAKKRLVMNWLPSVHLQDTHDERSASVTAGTGTWFQTHGMYQNWKTSVHSDLLWVKGKPGCGKSVLAALTWDELKLLQNDRTAVARFYCSSSDSERSSYRYLLTTLLKQISGQSPRLHHDLEQMYDKEALIQDRGPGSNDAEKLLPTILSGFAEAFFILDGLDELREAKAFLNFLPILLREKTCKLRVIVFCRDYIPERLPLQNPLKDYPQLNVDQGANKDDIKIFISSKLSTANDPDWDPELLDVVKTIMLDRADGMFLYVSLMVGRLSGSLSQNEVIARLKSLPKTLTKAYEAYLERILDQEEEADKALTVKILLWIANANRPLSRKELLEALCIRHGTKEKDKGGTDRDFTTFCAELVYVDQNGFYHLVHTSLQDYLLDLRKDTSGELQDYRALQLHAESILGEACLTYLLFEQFSRGPVRTADELVQLLQENAFLGYAAKNWGSHVALAAEDAPTDLVWKFIDNEDARNLCMQVIMAEEDLYPFPEPSSPLHILAYFGLSTSANARCELKMLRRQVDGFGLLPLDYAMMAGRQAMSLWLLDNAEDSVSGAVPMTARYSAYHVAIVFGWDDVLERLISNGHDVNHVFSNIKRTPLAEATAQGNGWAVNRLLGAKADVNAKDAEGKNPLMIALAEGHQSLTLPLLQNGTDLDAQDDDGVTALHLAVDDGNLEIIKALLERKPTLQRTDEEYWNQTPLHLAAEHDYDKIFIELHKYGAELESTCMGGFRPMHLAAFHNSLKVARLLVELGAEMNPPSDDGRTVLHVAAANSGVDFIELILNKTFDVDATEKEVRNTALHEAAQAGATAACELLLKKGAGVDIPNVTNHTALHLAVTEGHTQTAKLLLDHKFNPMKTAVFDSPVLHYAANKGTRELVQPLIDAQADPEAPNTHGHRALHFAARVGHKDFVEQLFKSVPQLDANSRDHEDKTALHLAAAAGHVSTIQVLCERGAKLNNPDSSKNLPIHYAAWNGHFHVVEILISDATVNAQGYNGRTVLCIGALRGHENIVRLLLDRKAMLELGDDNQSTPLMHAVQMKRKEIAQLLISRDADIHTINGQRRTLLHEAARSGNYDLVELFLDRNCDGHAVSNFSETPFLDAVSSNNLKIIDLFSERGVDGSHDKNKIGTTAVHIAAEEGNLQMLARLLNAGANPAVSDRIGRSALSVAAMEGRHALVAPLLRLGLGVDGFQNCYSTPLGNACESGHVRVAETLVQHGASIHVRTKHDNMTPLHQAAANNKPQIIRQLVSHGADIYSRDCYANSALDYASRHPASFQAIKHDDIQDKTIDLAGRRAVLWRTIRQELESLISLDKPRIVETELARLLKLGVLANCFLYLRDTDMYQTVKYLYMEMSFQTESAALRFTFDCETCKTTLNGFDIYVCVECHELRLCGNCLQNYNKGWKAPNSTPEGVKELEELEKQVEPFREALLPILDEIRLQFVFLIFVFFPSVQAWADAKRKEYEAWENKFNEDDVYKYRKRPCQELLRLLEEGRVFMKSIEEKGVSFDEERGDCAALITKFSEYHRIHNVLKDDAGFDCADHEYLQITKKEYDRVCSDRHIFHSDRRLAEEWFRELLAKVERKSYPGADLRESTKVDVPSENLKDGLNAAVNVSAGSQAVPSEDAQQKAEDALDKDQAATQKPSDAHARSRPKFPQGLKSQNIAPKIVTASAEQDSLADDKVLGEELRSPTVAAAAFSNLTGDDEEAFTGRISNTQRFAAELLERHPTLERRVTSPRLGTEGSSTGSSLKRRATMPLRSIQESQEWTVTNRFMNIQRPIASEARATNSSTPPLTSGSDHPLPSQESTARTTINGESRVTISISNINKLGHLVMLALKVTESVFPGSGEQFITTRLEQGDLADYWLQLD